MTSKIPNWMSLRWTSPPLIDKRSDPDHLLFIASFDGFLMQGSNIVIDVNADESSVDMVLVVFHIPIEEVPLIVGVIPKF